MVNVFPTGDEPIEDVIARNCARYVRQSAARRKAEWLPINLPEVDGSPFAVAWVGDPHMDDQNCAWPQLVEDLSRIKETPGVYGANLGDLTNNWVGRLTRLYADQSTSKQDARRLAAWFLKGCGVDWRLSILGNHDVWNEGDAILGLIADNAFYVADWSAKVEFRAGQHRFRVHAAHDFKGSSIYNKTHGPAKAAIFSGGEAELYVAGHTHTVASQAFEAGPGNFVRIVRASGYKGHDMHAVVNGYKQAQCGASVLTIFNPNARSKAGRVMVFEDLAAGCEVLTALRKDYRAQPAKTASPKAKPANLALKPTKLALKPAKPSPKVKSKPPLKKAA